MEINSFIEFKQKNLSFIITKTKPDEIPPKNQNRIILVWAFHEIIELVEDNEIEIAGMIDNERTGNYRSYKM